MPKNTLKNRVASLSDGELRTVITAVARAAGLSAEKSAELVSDIPKLRRVLMQADDEQFSAFISAIGRQTGGRTDISSLLEVLGDK